MSTDEQRSTGRKCFGTLTHVEGQDRQRCLHTVLLKLMMQISLGNVYVYFSVHYFVRVIFVAKPTCILLFSKFKSILMYPYSDAHLCVCKTDRQREKHVILIRAELVISVMLLVPNSHTLDVSNLHSLSRIVLEMELRLHLTHYDATLVLHCLIKRSELRTVHTCNSSASLSLAVFLPSSPYLYQPGTFSLSHSQHYVCH